MRDLEPHLIVSGLSANEHGKSLIVQARKKLDEMGIFPYFAPENFSHSEILSWISDVTKKNDFFLNFTFGAYSKVCFRDEAEAEMAKIFANQLTNRTDDIYENPTPLFSVAGDEALFLSSLPLHTWDIHISLEGKTDDEVIMTMMACITDLFFMKHSLLDEKRRWPFRDVPSSSFAFESIKKAKKRDLIPGYKGDILRPNGGITRAEMLYILDKLHSIDIQDPDKKQE